MSVFSHVETLTHHPLLLGGNKNKCRLHLIYTDIFENRLVPPVRQLTFDLTNWKKVLLEVRFFIFIC